MSIYAIQFEHDNGSIREKKICFAIANSEQEARDKFDAHIYRIFCDYEDQCDITAIIKLLDATKLLYSPDGNSVSSVLDSGTVYSRDFAGSSRKNESPYNNLHKYTYTSYDYT